MVSGLFLFIKNLTVINTILCFLLLSFLYQLYTGVAQYTEAVNYSENISLELKGSFQNSGVFGFCLVAHLPVVWYCLFHLLKRTLQKAGKPRLAAILTVVIFVAVSVTALFLIFQTQSRSAWIALVATAGAGLVTGYFARIKAIISRLPRFVPILCIMCFTGLATVAGYYLFALKKMSAMGRMMKLSITWDHITDQFWLGTGLGRFSNYYPYWQAAYFKNHPHPPESFFLSAGESYILFNEPLQLFKEVGALGFLVWGGCLILFFRTKPPKEQRRLFVALKLVVVSLLVCGFTSYPFHVNYLILMATFCFFVVVALGRSGWLHNFKMKAPSFFTMKPALILTIATLIFTSYKGIKTFYAYNRWDHAADHFSGNDTALIKEYEAIFPYLSGDRKFLTVYGKASGRDSAAYPKAIMMLEQARQLHLSRIGIERLIDVYKMQGRFREAISHQEWLCNFLPNKFLPKHELMRLYLVNADTLNAKKTAQDILLMPVKINSAEVENVRKEATAMLNR